MSLVDGNLAMDEEVLDELVLLNEQGTPHKVIERICGNIERYSLGLEAARMLELPRAERRGKALVILPMWSWGKSKHSVGRKDRPFSLTGEDLDYDQKLLMPIRNVWSDGLLHLTTQSETLSARKVGSGHTGAKQLHVAVTEGHLAVATATNDDSVVMITAGASSLVEKTLSQLVRDGQSAYWDMFQHWDGIVRRILERQSVGLIRELEEFQKEPISFSPLDTERLDKIRDEILLGVHDPETHLVRESRLRHYLNQAASEADLFVGVEPQRFLNRNLTRDCTQALRREVGDPHIGPKIRRFVLDHPELVELPEIIRAYNVEFPKDRLALDRASVALGIGRDLARVGRMVSLADGRDQSHVESAENQAIEGLGIR